MSYSVAVGGATGNVGSAILAILEQRAFPISQLTVLASAKAAKTINFKGRDYPVQSLADFDFSKTDILFLSTGGENSKTISPRAEQQGCTVIDNSSAFSMDPACALLVPEVNAEVLDQGATMRRKIYPVANCSTIQLVMALKPLHQLARVKRIIMASYQSCSGGGRNLLQRLAAESQAMNAGASPGAEVGQATPLAFNVVPHIDVFLDDGRTKEEWKLEVETRKILNDPEIQVIATCVRVPVFVSHAEAVYVEFERPLSLQQAGARLAEFPGVSVLDRCEAGGYATPLLAAGRDEVFVSRLRADPHHPHALSFWVVADNIRKGAALNAVQIAELLARRGLLRA